MGSHLEFVTFQKKKFLDRFKAELLLLKLIHLFVKGVVLLQKLEIEETKTN